MEKKDIYVKNYEAYGNGYIVFLISQLLNDNSNNNIEELWEMYNIIADAFVKSKEIENTEIPMLESLEKFINKMGSLFN